MNVATPPPLAKIKTLLAEHRYKQARLVLDEMPPHHSEGIVARLLIAEALVTIQPTISIELLQSVIASHSKLPRAWRLLGVAYQHREDLHAAIDSYAVAFNHQPDDADTAELYEGALRSADRWIEADRIKQEHAALTTQHIDKLPTWCPPDALPSDADRAAYLYLNLLERCVANWIYRDPYIAETTIKEFDPWHREWGKDIPTVAHTMIGLRRLRHLRYVSEIVIREKIPGDFMEAGVWRGGACILMRGVLAVRGDTSRSIWLADSFAGLPPPDPRYEKDRFTLFNFHERRELAVDVKIVRENFARYNLLDGQVRFVEGLFKDTLPALKDIRLSILRLDGDLYSSTMDILVNLYDRVTPGGFIIVDDYGAVIDSRRAVLDFRTTRGIREPMTAIDKDGIFWRKTAEAPAKHPEAMFKKRSLLPWLKEMAAQGRTGLVSRLLRPTSSAQ